MKARSKGTIPSPTTSFPSLPSKGRYDVAATSSSTFVVNRFPDKPELQTQVMSMPRSFKLSVEHPWVSSISRSNPLVWSTSALSGEIWGVPSVIRLVHFSLVHRSTAVDFLARPPRYALATHPPIECPTKQRFTSVPSSAMASEMAFSIASKYQSKVL